jgi:hypothetical protein
MKVQDHLRSRDPVRPSLERLEDTKRWTNEISRSMLGKEHVKKGMNPVNRLL